ncbi:hypothetical protein SDC9_194811 [bioreactor metagenome]|uniref:Peptidoglycan O-acetyltransferase n=1 Tax=bioreactor metagenome TaxID=1076179 RepID=A0A645I7V5_9ZZZZ
MGWLIFVFEDTAAGMEYFKNMFGSAGFINSQAVYDLVRTLPLLIVLSLASTPYPKRIYYRLYDRFPSFRSAAPILTAAVLLLSVAFLVDSGFNPFLYLIF